MNDNEDKLKTASTHYDLRGAVGVTVPNVLENTAKFDTLPSTVSQSVGAYAVQDSWSWN